MNFDDCSIYPSLIFVTKPKVEENPDYPKINLLVPLFIKVLIIGLLISRSNSFFETFEDNDMFLMPL